MWRFQRSRNDSHPATALAKRLAFPEWVRFHLEERRSSPLLNQQTLLFSFQYDQRTPVNHPEILDRAIENVQDLSFVGIVEHFEASMRIYERLYRPLVRQLEFDRVAELNRSAEEDLPEKEKIARIEEQLGSGLFSELSERMRLDLDLYEHCMGSFEQLQRDLDVETA